MSNKSNEDNTSTNKNGQITNTEMFSSQYCASRNHIDKNKNNSNGDIEHQISKSPIHTYPTVVYTNIKYEDQSVKTKKPKNDNPVKPRHRNKKSSNFKLEVAAQNKPETTFSSAKQPLMPQIVDKIVSTKSNESNLNDNTNANITHSNQNEKTKSENKSTLKNVNPKHVESAEKYTNAKSSGVVYRDLHSSFNEKQHNPAAIPRNTNKNQSNDSIQANKQQPRLNTPNKDLSVNKKTKDFESNTANQSLGNLSKLDQHARSKSTSQLLNSMCCDVFEQNIENTSNKPGSETKKSFIQNASSNLKANKESNEIKAEDKQQTRHNSSKSVIVSVLNASCNDVLKKYDNDSIDKTIVQVHNITNDVLQKRESDTEFEKNFIFKLKKQSKQNEQAKYKCNICNYFCNNTDVVRKHISGSIHKNNFENIKLEMKIRELEMPSSRKIEQLSSFLIDFYLKNKISNEQLTERFKIYHKFKDALLSRYPDYQVNIYGSTVHGICSNDSACDISIEYENNNPNAKKHSNQIIADVLELIKSELSDTFNVSQFIPSTDSGKKPQAEQISDYNSNKMSIESLNSKITFNFTSDLFPSAYKTSTLLKTYIELDERAKILSFCLRHIAKLSQIDKVDNGTLPPHSYIIMTIYFLQRLSPSVLPVLHQIIDSKNLFKISKSTKCPKKNANNSSNAECNESSAAAKVQDDDNNETYNPVNQFAPLQHLIDSETLNFESETMSDNIKNFNIFRKNLQNYVEKNDWNSTNSDSVGALWLKLLSFYSIDFGFKKSLVSIRSRNRITKSGIKMYTKKISIEDPFSMKQSLSRNLTSQTNKYITSTISKTCLYFVQNTHNNVADNSGALCDNKVEKIIERLIAETGILEARKTNKDLDDDEDNNQEGDDDDADDDDDDDDADTECFTNTLSKSGSKLASSSKPDEIKLNHSDDILHLKELTLDDDYKSGESLSSLLTTSSISSTPNGNESTLLKYHSKFETSQDATSTVHEPLSSCDTNEELNSNIRQSSDSTRLELQHLIENCLSCMVDNVAESCELNMERIPNVELSLLKNSLSQEKKFNYKFNASSIGFAKSPPKLCLLCNKEGHLQNECPQDRLPLLEELPKLTKEWIEVLNNVCIDVMENNMQTLKEEADRNTLFSQITQIVLGKYPEANLSLFGSSNNGFAMKKSDLDICMILKNYPDETKNELNFKKIIRSIGGLFRREGDFDMIEERLSAKVPIVKFRHKKTMIEGDISLYNTLALQNTDLLRSYALIDERTKILGHMVKHFAKKCRIGDASCGSLSSYAYIVMMIHYLMNAQPPVLPCLQKINREHLPLNDTTLNIDGWDCWFNRDINNLSKIWPYHNKNKQSVGELWLGFLCYYTEKFDWENNVVCLRDNNPLTRKSKNWTKHRLAIEDPFELTHNLAAGVSPKMGLYILKSFAKARSLFGTVKPDLKLDIDYFFDPKSLMEGNPPMDRNCYTCLKIGHQTKDCPAANLKKKQFANNDVVNDDNTSSFTCYRCQNVGHKAKDCTLVTESKRQKTISLSSDLNPKCYNCNQNGHFARDCITKNYHKPTYMFINQQNKYLKMNHQQSDVSPKNIRIVTPTSNAPVVMKTVENAQFATNSGSSNLNANANTLINKQYLQHTSQMNKGPKLYLPNAAQHNSDQIKLQLQRQQSHPTPSTASNNFQKQAQNQYQQYQVIENEAKTDKSQLNTSNSDSYNNYQMYQFNNYPMQSPSYNHYQFASAPPTAPHTQQQRHFFMFNNNLNMNSSNLNDSIQSRSFLQNSDSTQSQNQYPYIQNSFDKNK